MSEIKICKRCSTIFSSTNDICRDCIRREEELYPIVYRFLRKRENRAATIERIEEATGVEREILYKWVKKGRLHTANFPNLGYPCDNCGHLTREGKICVSCRDNIESDLKTFELTKRFREDIKKREKGTYLANKKKE